MKKISLFAVLAAMTLTSGLVAAQKPTAASSGDQAAQPPPKAAGPGKAAPAGGKTMGRGMMGRGMMDEGGMMCPGRLGEGAKVEVSKQPKGVTITITSDDPAVVTRAQKMAEAMKLMHEAQAR